MAGRRPIKQQIRRLSPHQNAKVFAVLFALSSLIFLVPFGLFAMAMGPSGARMGGAFFLFAPLIYLAVGYVMTLIGCAIYNALFRFIGGIEYESDAEGV